MSKPAPAGPSRPHSPLARMDRARRMGFPVMLAEGYAYCWRTDVHASVRSRTFRAMRCNSARFRRANRGDVMRRRQRWAHDTATGR